MFGKKFGALLFFVGFLFPVFHGYYEKKILVVLILTTSAISFTFLLKSHYSKKCQPGVVIFRIKCANLQCLLDALIKISSWGHNLINILFINGYWSWEFVYPRLLISYVFTKLDRLQYFLIRKLLRTCFSLPDNSSSCCVLIDLDDPSAVSGLEFLNTPGNAVQKRALTYFYEPLRGDVGEKLGLKNCDLFAFKKTGGSNLDPENLLYSTDGGKVAFTDHICPNYDLVFAITDYSLTAPLTAMAKEFGFRGATLHGLNETILNSGLSIDYHLVSCQAELFRSFLDQADRFNLTFECHNKSYELIIECNNQTAFKRATDFAPQVYRMWPTCRQVKSTLYPMVQMDLFHLGLETVHCVK